jgi:predicted DNA-binding transcriptional regulator YafY
MHKYHDYGLFSSLIKLVLWMQGSVNGVNIQGIMDRFEVSRRTAERMRNAVVDLFPSDYIEIRDGTSKRFKLRAPILKGVALASFKEEELGSLKIASDLLRKNNLISQATLLDSLGDKLKSVINISSEKSHNIEDILKFEGLAMKPAPRISTDPKTSELIREAMGNSRQIKITYQNISGKTSDFELIPLGFLYGDRNHYLVAKFTNYEKNKVRHFIIDRIRNIEILDDSFEVDRKFNLEKHAAKSFGAFQEKPFNVEWLFAPEAADDAKKMIFHPTQQLSLNPDGSLTVKFKAGGKVEMAWHLFTWGNKVKVIQPKDFWESIPEVLEGFPAK